MKKVYIILLIIIIILVLGFLAWRWWLNKTREPGFFPPQPTKRERETMKILPKELCPCWDGIRNECLPQADCI